MSLAKAAAGAAVCLAAVAPMSARAASSTSFGTPVALTPTAAGGYEPSVIADAYGNLFATAHKEVWQLAVAPDTGSPTGTRGMSWTWMSADGGRTWQNLPGLVQDKVVGDEGDFALDGAGHLYFADLSFADSSLTRWTVTGRGKVTWDFTRPAIPTAGIDDRPWLAAHGDGKVLYVGEILQARDASFSGEAGTTIHRSTDGGVTFVEGPRLPGTTYCKPATDRLGTHSFFVVMCRGVKDEILAFTSYDDGATFTRTFIAQHKGWGSRWPTADIAADGSVTAVTTYDNSRSLLLMRSTDRGRHFTARVLALPRWQYDMTVIAVSPDNHTLGLGTYAKRAEGEPWRIFGATWRPPAAPKLVSLDEANPVAPADAPGAPHDLMGTTFGAGGKHTVVWTREGMSVGQNPSVQTLRQVFAATSVDG